MTLPEQRPTALTSNQQRLADLWDEHVRDEFVVKNADVTVDTMVPDAYVNHVPVMTGGYGQDQLREFYATHFIPKMPPDTSIEPVSRTVDTDRVVDEMIFRFTHTMEMDWMLPASNQPAGMSRCRWWLSFPSGGTSSSTSTFTGIKPQYWSNLVSSTNRHCRWWARRAPRRSATRRYRRTA